MTNSSCSDQPGNDPCEGTLLKAEDAALEMYRFAALLLGDESEALSLVETKVAEATIDPCAAPGATKAMVRQQVLDGALAIMQQHDPASFANVPVVTQPSPCIEEDDSSPLLPGQLEQMASGQDRGRLRGWLDQLTQAQRAIFVQRAILGSSNADTAASINRIAKPARWTPEAVAGLFRQALCSLASSLLQAAPPVHASN